MQRLREKIEMMSVNHMAVYHTIMEVFNIIFPQNANEGLDMQGIPILLKPSRNKKTNIRLFIFIRLFIYIKLFICIKLFIYITYIASNTLQRSKKKFHCFL